MYGVLDEKSVLEFDFQNALALFYGVTLFMGAYVLQVDTYLRALIKICCFMIF